MKKTIKIFLILNLFLLLSGCNSKKDLNEDNKYNYIIEVIEKDNCNYKPELYYTEDERSIYTYCLDSVKITEDGKTTELKSYIKSHNKTLGQVINTLILESSLNDGEKESYLDGGTKKITNNDLTFIRCNATFQSYDIYIGPKNMKMKSNFCNADNRTFVRTYTVKSVEKYTEQQYTEDGVPTWYFNSFKVTLSQFQGETKELIINAIPIDLKEDETYEFEFMNNGILNDDIESIFKKSTIVEIRKTDKIGLAQTQDSIN